MPVHLREVGIGGMPEVDPVIVELTTTPTISESRIKTTKGEDKSGQR